MPTITRLNVGFLGTCCYIVAADAATGEESIRPAVVIDPGDEAPRITSDLKRMGLRLELILLTHSHHDHIGAVEDLRAAWPEARLACSVETSRRIADPTLNLSRLFGFAVAANPADILLRDGESFIAAGLHWRAVEISGHDKGEMVYILGDGKHAENVFSGDTLFAGSVGRTDFPDSDGEALIRGLLRLLVALPKRAAVHPGHGPSTTVMTELHANPFLR